MTPLRAVIVDDEPMARQALQRMLAEFPEVRVCGQADSVHKAEVLIRDQKAHVVYLDIELFGRKAGSTWSLGLTRGWPWSSSPPLTNMPSAPLRSMRSTIC